MHRRSLLAAAAASLFAPAIARGAEKRVLRFIPQSDLTVLDPVWTTAYVTRNHAFMVWDTLYGQDGRPTSAQPQMAEGHTCRNGGRHGVVSIRPAPGPGVP